MVKSKINGLLPTPKEVYIHKQKIEFPSRFNLRFKDVCNKDIQQSIKDIFNKKSSLVSICENGLPVVFMIDKKEIKEGNGEGYVLSIKSNGIKVVANGQTGLYYGALTFLQILENSDELFELTIRDWPSIKMRMFHLDLKRIPLEFGYVKNLITKLSEHKINSILIEYEDKFPFRKYPDIQVKSAMTHEQIQELGLLCKSKCVEIIPLVQSYGHFEYILTKDKYKHLREDPRRVNEICGTNPEAKELVLSMMEEVIDAHHDLKYFHIGADEPFRVHFCPECKKIIDQKGKGALYLQHIKPIVEFVQKKGLIPIIWDDMLTTHLEISGKLPKPLIINYWEYYSHTDTSDSVLVRGIGQLALKDALQHSETTKIELHKKYWQCNKFPKEAKTFPLVRYYQDLGYEVLGGSAARCSRQSPISITERVENIHYFSKRINEENAFGILATSWSASNSLAQPAEYWEYFWYPQLAAAEHTWTGGETDIIDYANIFLQTFYGIKDDIFVHFLLQNEEEKIQSLPRFLKYLEDIYVAKNKKNYQLFQNSLKRLYFQSQYKKIIENDFRKIIKYKENAIMKIDLSRFANRGYYDKEREIGWSNEGINDMIEFPTGKNVFGGIPFDIDEPDINNNSIICMNNVMDQDELPELIEGIPVNTKCKTINFIHTLSKNDVAPKTCVGHYYVNYQDGSIWDIKIVEGENIANWWKSDSGNKMITAWRGKNRYVKNIIAQTVGISLFQWINPFPKKEIGTISIQTEQNSSWLIIAINAVKCLEHTENKMNDWLELKKEIESIESNFTNAWEEEAKALENFISDNLIDFYSDINYQPIKNIFKSLLTL